MKTLHLDTEPDWRGGQQQLLYLLEGLLERGIAAVLLAQPGSLLLERVSAVGVDARAFRARGEADLGTAHRLARLFRDESFDLLHCHTAHAHGIAVAARRLAPREKFPKLVVSRRVAFRPGGSGLFKLGRFKYRQADRIVAVSRSVKEGLVRLGVEPGRIAVVHDGIDVARIEQAPERSAGVRRALGLRQGEKMVANVAHLGEEKGHRDLVAATPTIRAARPDVRIVLVGEGALRPELEQQVRALDLRAGVVFAGFRPPEEIPTILKATDIFVFPSVEEGLGSTLFEAMAAGAPIVSTCVGGIPEIVRDNETGLLVPPRRPEALAEAVLRLLNDHALARHLTEAARRFVCSEGTRQRMAEETIRIYRELLPGGPAPAHE